MDGNTVEEACPRCGSTDLVHDPETGEVICASCSTVMREETLELKPRRRLILRRGEQGENGCPLKPCAG